MYSGIVTLSPRPRRANRMNSSPFVHREIDEISTVEWVTDVLRRAILDGTMYPGQMFSLRQVGRQLGVSFIPVREALRSLEAEGLLINRPGRSAAVAPLDPAELHSICQLRRRIEPELAAMASPRIPPSDLEKWESRSGVAPRGKTDAGKRHEAHRELLQILLLPGGTTWESRMLQILWRATERYLRASPELGDHCATETDQLHLAELDLITAYRTRVPEQARAAMIRHLEWIETVADSGLAAAH